MSLVFLKRHAQLSSPYFVELPLVFFDPPLFALCEFGEVLLGRFGEAIADFDFPDSANHLVVVDFRLEIKEDGEKEFFLRVDELLVEAKALYL